jgi:hypothetical protein
MALLAEKTTAIKIIGSFPQKDQNVYIKPKPNTGSQTIENPLA